MIRSDLAFRHDHSIRRLLTLGAAAGALALAACGDIEPDEDQAAAPAALNDADTETALVTNVFEPAGAVDALAFMPVDDAPWTGLIAASLSDGGFDIYDIDGDRVIQASGPRMSAIAAAPGFELRGESLPLLLGLDEDGALRGFVMVRAEETLIELPLDSGDVGQAAGLCRYREGIGYLDVTVLSADESAQIWRITDQGREALALERREDIPLPFSASACAEADGDIVFTAPGAGLARIARNGDVVARVDAQDVAALTYAELSGRGVVLASLPGDGLLGVYDADTLETMNGLELESGLNAPGVETPGALAISQRSYGGMGFSTGVVAIYDDADSRIKLIARDVLSQALIDPEPES